MLEEIASQLSLTEADRSYLERSLDEAIRNSSKLSPQSAMNNWRINRQASIVVCRDRTGGTNPTLEDLFPKSIRSQRRVPRPEGRGGAADRAD